jgi:hypothetical protein
VDPGVKEEGMSKKRVCLFAGSALVLLISVVGMITILAPKGSAATSEEAPLDLKTVFVSRLTEQGIKVLDCQVKDSNHPSIALDLNEVIDGPEGVFSWYRIKHAIGRALGSDISVGWLDLSVLHADGKSVAFTGGAGRTFVISNEDMKPQVMDETTLKSALEKIAADASTGFGVDITTTDLSVNGEDRILDVSGVLSNADKAAPACFMQLLADKVLVMNREEGSWVTAIRLRVDDGGGAPVLRGVVDYQCPERTTWAAEGYQRSVD